VIGQAPGGIDPVEPGHADVHQHDVRVGVANDLHGLKPVGGLPDDLNPAGFE
jgi:hypothetical protein